MTDSDSLPEFYSSLLKFLLTAKQHMITNGKDHDLTVMQEITLLLANANQPKPMKTYQHFFNCDASNITGIVDGLEEKGLVTRAEQPDDRRVKVIQITDKGVALKKEIEKTLIEIDDEILSPLSQVELEQFRSIIIKLSSTTLL